MVNAGAISGSVGAIIDEAGSVLAALAVFFASLALAAFRVGRMDGLIPPVPMQLPSQQDRTGPLESLLTRIGKSPVARTVGQRATLEGRLLLAGEPASVEAVLGAKVMASIGAAALVAILGMATGLSVALLALGVPIVLAATRAPDFVLARRARTRDRRIAAQVPDLAELLVATTGAGLNPPLAFRRSAEVLEGPLGEELRVAVRGLDLGAEWRTVLDELADRTGDPSMRRLVRAMGRSQRLGTPLASALHSVADDLRNERQARAEEAARRAPVKMLFPLVFLILPAFLLLTVGPVLLATLRSLR
jgi:tight adherence protein C